MKIKFSTILTILLCIVLVMGAVCIGAVRGWSDEREKLLLSCVERHNVSVGSIRRSVEECRECMQDYDHRLSTELTGRIAGKFGVEPIGNSVESLHEQLLHKNVPEEELPALQSMIGALLDDHIDTSLSLGKVVLTIIFLMVIFGNRGRKKGFTFGKLLAGFGLFRLWKRR
ncbi:MAG: hypothetical protein IJZ74_01950 [Clostridia bacterium]|nr:hypothetical protein [Clostridia bacterium]